MAAVNGMTLVEVLGGPPISALSEMKLVYVPLDRLEVSGQNARKVAPDPDKLAELTASIEAHGLLEPLIVSGSAAGAMVIGGSRRLAAMQQLVAAGKWEPGRPVGCVLVSNGASADTAESFEMGRRNLELSLAENTGREELHPVDQAEAFRVLRDEQGATDKQLAARFGVSGRTVQRRLRMAQAAPELRRKCRDGELSLGVLEAVCIEPDHERQAEAAATAGPHGPSAVMSYLKKESVSADSCLGRFVGLERYEADGGLVSQDLSADGGRGAHYMDDKPKVLRLMMERLREEARKERDVNGWPAKQVKCAEDLPWNYYNHWDRSDATKLSDLPEPARAGAVLHLGMSGTGDVARLVLVKKGTLAHSRPSSPIGEDDDSPEEPASLPFSLVHELRAMRLSVLREAFFELSDTGGELARDLLTFALARKIYARYAYGESIGLSLSATSHPNLADSYEPGRLPPCVKLADEALSEVEPHLLGWLGGDPDAKDGDRLADLQWTRFRELPAGDRVKLLTCCVARMLAPSRPGGTWADRAIHGAIDVNWPALFDPGPEILSRLTKAQLLEIARRDFPAGRLDAGELEGLKKAELVERIAAAAAECRAASGESPWLPAEVFGDRS